MDAIPASTTTPAPTEQEVTQNESLRDSRSPDSEDVSNVRKTFKSQSLNSLFRRSSPERSPRVASPSPHLPGKGSPIGEKLTLNKTSPNLGNAALAKGRGSSPLSMASSTGNFKLAPMKRDGSNTNKPGIGSGTSSTAQSPRAENSTVWKVASEPAPPDTTSHFAKPHENAGETLYTDGGTVGSSTAGGHSARKKSMTEMSEEELLQLGIHLTHRLGKDEKNNRAFNWDDDDDDNVAVDSEWAKLQHLDHIPNSTAPPSTQPLPSSRRTVSTKEKENADKAAVKLAPWGNVSSEKKDFVPIDEQIRELSEKKLMQQQQHQRHNIRHTYRQNNVHGFHGARGGDSLDDGGLGDGWDSFGGARERSPQFRRGGGGFDDFHHNNDDGRYRFQEHDRRYRDSEPPSQELYHGRGGGGGRFEPDGGLPPPHDRGFGGPRRFSRDNDLEDLGRGGRPPSFENRRPSMDDDWRRRDRPSPFGPPASRTKGAPQPDEAHVPSPLERRRPSIASSEGSHISGTGHGTSHGTSQDNVLVKGESAAIVEEKQTEAHHEVDALEAQKERMRAKLEAARKRKELEQQQEQERLEAAKRKADALDKQIEEKHKKEEAERARIAEEKRRKEEEETRRNVKYVLPSHRPSSGPPVLKLKESTDQNSTSSGPQIQEIPHAIRGRSRAESNVSIDDSHTIRAVEKLVTFDEKDDLAQPKEPKVSRSSGSGSKKIWVPEETAVPARSRLWGGSGAKSAESVWGTPVVAEEEEAPWNGDWRAARAEHRRDDAEVSNKRSDTTRNHSRFFPTSSEASEISETREVRGAPRVVLPAAGRSERPNTVGSNILPAPQGPVMESSLETVASRQRTKPKINLPRDIKDLPTVSKVKVGTKDGYEQGLFRNEKGKELVIKLGLKDPRVVKGKISKDKNAWYAVAPLMFSTSSYFQDVRGYVHRREYEQTGNGPEPSFVMVRVPGHGKIEIPLRASRSHGWWK